MSSKTNRGISISRQQPQSLIMFLWLINCSIVTWFKKKSIIISKGQCIGGPLTLIATSRSSSVPLQTVMITELRIRLGSQLLVTCCMSLAKKILIGSNLYLDCLAFFILILFSTHKVTKQVDITSYVVKAHASLNKITSKK